MLRKFFRPALLLVAIILIASNAFTQSTAIPAPPTTPYGMSINLETAKKAAAAAVAEARKNNWTMAVAILDTGGYLVYLEKMDGTQTGSVDVSIEKARSAVLFRRPTKVFQDSVATGGEGSKFLRLTGAVPIDGGFPIIMDGKIIGAIGVSGGAGDQDGRCGKAGADSIK
jgi:glc operon protein GlcG